MKENDVFQYLPPDKIDEIVKRKKKGVRWRESEISLRRLVIIDLVGQGLSYRRIIEELMNRWSLEFHDKHRVERFEISYMKEGHEGEEAIITIDDASLDVKMDLAVEGESLVKARVVFVNR